MTNRDELLTQVHLDIERLTRPYDHAEQADGKMHRSKHASLLDQLEEELIDSTPAGDGPGSKQTPGSKPPVREDIAILIWEAERIAQDLVKDLGGKPRGVVDLNLALVGALAGSANDETLESIAWIIGRLRSNIETQLNWRLRPRRLAGACPECHKTNAIVVHMDSYGPTGAKCSKCNTVWEREVLGLLGGSISA